jgi:ATP-dependent Clp endopeptidase proteolytic subunit ClpP
MPMKKIYLNGVIHPWMISSQYVDYLLQDISTSEEIEVYLNSPGGSVSEGFAIYNALASRNTTIKIYGEASSIASLIACAGKKVLMAETAFMLLHNPFVQTVGNSGQLRKQADNLDVLKASMLKAYSGKTGKAEKEISKLLDEERYYNSEQCKELGLIDEIYKPGIEDMIVINKELLQGAVAMNGFYQNFQNVELPLQPQSSQEPVIKNENENLTNQSGSDMDLKQELDKLRSDFLALSTEKTNLLSTTDKLKQELETARTELAAKMTANKELQETINKNEVEAFVKDLVMNKRLLPSEVAIETKTLLALKNVSQDLFNERKTALEARKLNVDPTQEFEQGSSASSDNTKFTNESLDNPVENKLLTQKALALSNERKISFADAVELIIGGKQ